jgi:hypothetical protein
MNAVKPCMAFHIRNGFGFAGLIVNGRLTEGKGLQGGCWMFAAFLASAAAYILDY